MIQTDQLIAKSNIGQADTPIFNWVIDSTDVDRRRQRRINKLVTIDSIIKRLEYNEDDELDLLPQLDEDYMPLKIQTVEPQYHSSIFN